MADPEEKTLPWRVRLPWFAIWVPVALLLYTLVNGAGHVRVADCLCQNLDFKHSQEVDFVLRAAAFPCGLWGFLIVPVLAVFATVSWKLCPQWSPGVRRVSGWLGIWLFLSFLLAQVAMLFPSGWQVGMPSGRQLRVYAIQLWKPHLCRPVLEDFAWNNPDPSPAWKAQASDFAFWLKDPDGVVQAGASVYLAKLRVKEYAPGIAVFLRNSDRVLAADAARALGRLGAKEYIPELAVMLKDPDDSARYGAANALGDLGAKEYAPELAAMLKDSSGTVPRAAAEALGSLGAKEYAPAIADLLKSGGVRGV